MLEHMKAVKITEKQLEKLDISEWIMEEKFKGIRAWYHKEFGLTRLISRGGEDISANFPHLCEINHLPHLSNVLLDCELYDERQQDEIVSGWAFSGVGLDPDKTKNCVLKVFDILKYESEDLIDHHQIERKEILKHCKLNGPLQLVEWFEAKDHRRYYEHILSKNGEGIMLKKKDSLYQPGRRTVKCWFKRKRRDSYDVVITGFTAGKGKFHGLIGAIEVSQFISGNLVHICNVSGMDDATRQDMTLHPDAYKYKVAVVFAMEQDQKSCALIEPSFSHLRYDKRIEDCTPEIFHTV